jgi:hypothetical protein
MKDFRSYKSRSWFHVIIVPVSLSKMLLPNGLPKLQKSFLREHRVSSEATKVIPTGAQSKFRSSEVVPKGMQSQKFH